jgi:F-type H+-transporting ATPase subunit delta
VRDETVARSYAETLFELAQRHEGVEAFGAGMETVARLLDDDSRFRLFLETPRIADADKKAVLRKALGDALPKNLLNFLLITVDKRRQRLLREIALQYHGLVDESMGREHVEVTLARSVDDDTREMIAKRLSVLLGKEAIPHVQVDPGILGGIIVRTGDTIYDGSVKRRLDGMRRTLMKAALPVGDEA